ncbi:MAG: RNA methyltransferase [Deltaproteobacteria bacterium]|nr:MAG: RNA methyltransferase [Deltaproteobacteria bacterium]
MVGPSQPLPRLFGMLPEELCAHLQDHGVRANEGEARRYLAHWISHGQTGVPRKPPSRKFLDGARDLVDHGHLEVVERVTDPTDGFTKYLFRSPDGALSEAVRIPLAKEGCFTVCLSSQVGCAMQCDFCATGRLGLTRNLAPWEIVSAFCTVRDEAPGRVTGAVFMGQGEPFHNYDAVIQAARILSDPCGGRIAKKAITISTVGLVPQIRRFAAERHGYRLIVSLTSALPERRRALLPVAGRFEMEDLAAAIREYSEVAKGLVTVAWVLLGGVNHDQAEVDAIRALLGDVPLRVNLIDVNDAREEAEGGYRRATEVERNLFFDALQALEVPIVRRYSGGGNEKAACGMLAASHGATASPATRAE